jgi:L-rhamnose isomerase
MQPDLIQYIREELERDHIKVDQVHHLSNEYVDQILVQTDRTSLWVKKEGGFWKNTNHITEDDLALYQTVEMAWHAWRARYE